MELNHLSSSIIKAAINVHETIGPGLLESIYQQAMVIELEWMGIGVKPEVPLFVEYRGRPLCGDGFRMDLLVEDTIVAELKSVDEVRPVFQKQLLTYLRLAKKPLGLLFNFNVPLLKEGITRIINSAPAKGWPDLAAQQIRPKNAAFASLRAQAKPGRYRARG